MQLNDEETSGDDVGELPEEYYEWAKYYAKENFTPYGWIKCNIDYIFI